MNSVKVLDVKRRENPSIQDIPQTWESLFEKNVENLKEIIKKVSPIKIPLPESVFEAYHLVPLSRIRVVIIGQDPYPNYSPTTGEPYARGLAFSYSKVDGFSSSMKNVKLELERSYPGITLDHSCLTSWCYQGVFLLNTCLTLNKIDEKNVDIKEWRPFLRETVKEILRVNPDCIFVAWGVQAKDFLKTFTIKHCLTGGHPSGANSRSSTKFVGCDHFIKINEILESRGEQPIDWSLSS